MKPLVCAMGVSRKDAHLAATWLQWVRVLGCEIDTTVCYTRNTLAVDLDAMKEAAGGLVGSWVTFKVLPDEQENGYPGSASHLFVRTMEQAERDYPGHPVLWVEADAIPTRPTWFEEIEAEYQTIGSPFMGHLELSVFPPHMAGVAVYPPNWRELSPMLASSHLAPDTRQWGRGKGQAFDTYAAPEVLWQAGQSTRIQQVWNCPRITEENIDAIIKPETALFHQCKTGALINVLSGRLFPSQS